MTTTMPNWSECEIESLELLPDSGFVGWPEAGREEPKWTTMLSSDGFVSLFARRNRIRRNLVR